MTDQKRSKAQNQYLNDRFAKLNHLIYGEAKTEETKAFLNCETWHGKKQQPSNSSIEVVSNPIHVEQARKVLD